MSSPFTDNRKNSATTKMKHLPDLPKPSFKGKKISTFLEEYEEFADYYELNDAEKVRNLHLYVSKRCKLYREIVNEFKSTTNYKTDNWNEYKEEIRAAFADTDSTYSINKLRKLRMKRGKLALYLREFMYIASKLGEGIPDKTLCLLLYKNLTRSYREKIEEKFNIDKVKYQQLLEYLREKNCKWKTEASEFNDSDESDFDSSDSENEDDNNDITSETDSDDEPIYTKKKSNKKNEKIEKNSKKINPNEVTNENVDALAKELEKLRLLYTNLNVNVNAINTFKRSCIFCDSKEHIKRDCPYLSNALAKGDVKLNGENKITDSNGVLLTPRWNKGGIMAVLAERAMKQHNLMSNHITVSEMIELPTKHDVLVQRVKEREDDVDSIATDIYVKHYLERDLDDRKRMRLEDILNNDEQQMDVDGQKKGISNESTAAKIVASVPGVTSTTKVKSPLANSTDITKGE